MCGVIPPIPSTGREADHSPPSRAEVKEWVDLCLHSPNTPSWCGAQLKHGDTFNFTFTVIYFREQVLHPYNAVIICMYKKEPISKN
jgi:hypothetical protein